jgi:type III secretory pathway component EscS
LTAAAAVKRLRTRVVIILVTAKASPTVAAAAMVGDIVEIFQRTTSLV